jgi:hypothetical protein
MTAAAADINTKKGFEFLEIEVQLAASQTIYKGTMVVRDAAGKARPGSDTAGYKLAGVSKGSKRDGVSTQTSGASDTKYVDLDRKGAYRFAATGLAITDIGKKVYLADDKTIQTTPTNVFAGYLVGIDTASWGWVDIEEACHDADVEQALGDVELVGVAANKAVTVGQVCLDADGFLVDSDDATAVSFWGFALEAGDNTGGSDGDISVAVRRSGTEDQAAVGLADADVGKEVWQATDNATVTITPGTKLVGHISVVKSATLCTVAYKRMPIVGQRTDRQFTIPFSHTGATLNGKSAFTDNQYKRRYIPLSMQFDVETSPGGTDTLTCTLTDGTTTFAAAATEPAVHGELHTPMVPATETMKADFDTDLTLTDTGSTTANVKGEIVCEAL